MERGGGGSIHSLRRVWRRKRCGKRSFRRSERSGETSQRRDDDIEERERKRRVLRGRISICWNKRDRRWQECEKLLEMKKDIETFLEVENRGAMLDGRVEEDEEEEKIFLSWKTTTKKPRKRMKTTKGAQTNWRPLASIFNAGKDSDTRSTLQTRHYLRNIK